MIGLRLFSQDKMNWFLAGFVFLWLIGMLVLGSRVHRNKKNKRRIWWILLCEMPVVISILHFLFGGFKGRSMFTVLTYGGVYLTAFLTAFLPLLMKACKRIVTTSIVIVIAVLGSIYTVGYPAITNCGTRNYTHQGYVASFESMVQNMREYNTLLEWKQTDINGLRADVLPMVREAEKKKNPALFCAALCRFAYYFYDGHTWVNISNSELQKKTERILAGNDYGLSMIRLTNGETIAIMVDDESKALQAGIMNGTRIIKWNGQDIDTAIQAVECIYTKEYGRWPVKENEDIYKPIFLAGKGDEEVEVTFLDEVQQEQTAHLKSIGSYRERLEQACEIMQAKDKLKDCKNYTTDMLTDTLGYMRISEETCTLRSDVMSYLSGSHRAVRDLFEKSIEELKAKGMKKLVIDMRNNTGGYSVIPLELASLFTKREIAINSMARVNKTKTTIIREDVVRANGTYADMEVIVLTNSRCVSAGDYLVYCMSQCENVRVVGITDSTGSSQPIGGNCVMTDGICDVKYPQNWMLDENGDRFIDTRADRKSRITLDERIPLTAKGVADMFTGIDYELEYIKERFK